MIFFILFYLEDEDFTLVFHNNKIGRITNVAMVEESNPPITTVANGR
jgi:hypothetical protein